MTREQIDKGFKARFDPAMVKNVPVDGSPSKGPDSAPVTIVEFADFECAHCAAAAPMLEKVFEQNKDRVRLVYKFYPLPTHTHGESAARAAAATIGQGKFWLMHHALFANQQRLEQPDLDMYAKEIGIEVSRFHAELQSPAAAERVARDKKLGSDLQISGTPSIFINGRLFDGQDLTEWVAMELAAAAETMTPSSSPAASAKPGAAPAPSAASAKAK